jgi:hypothetical protein
MVSRLGKHSAEDHESGLRLSAQVRTGKDTLSAQLEPPCGGPEAVSGL